MCPFVGGFPGQASRGTAAADRVIRVLRIAWMLQVSCRTVDEMASEFAVSRRTIYRDLRLIDRAALPLVTRQVGKAFRLVRAPSPPISVSGTTRSWA